MPHVMIEDACDLGIACQGLQLTTVRNASEILKLVDVYLNRSNRTALVDCVVVEAGRSQSLFVQLSQKDRQITVRLLPATDNAMCESFVATLECELLDPHRRRQAARRPDVALRDWPPMKTGCHVSLREHGPIRF